MAVNFRGYLFQDDGDAVSGATVQLLETGTTTVEASTTTDSDGLWYFSESDQDRYDVKITSGTSVRYIRWDDQISLKELDVRNNTGNTTPATTFTNLTNNAANQVAVFSGANSTKADNDEIYLSFKMHDSAGNLDEFARMTVVATDVTTTTEDGQIEFDVIKAGTLTKVWTVTSSTAGAMSFDMNVDALTIGSGADTDISLTFDANSADGVITWMEDEDYFKFSDEILMNSTEKVLFGDTGTFIHQSSDGVLTITSDTTVDINGAVVFDGALSGITNITLSGTLSDGNYTFDTSGNVSGLGTVGSGNITSTGTVQGTTITATTAFVPDASDGAALGTTSLEFSDLYLADGAVVGFGDDQEVTLTHVHDAGLLLSSTDKLQFGDSGTFIHQSSDGVLTIESDTTVDINGAVALNGAVTGATNITLSGELDAATLDISGNADIDGTLEADAITIDGTNVVTGSLITTLGTISAGVWEGTDVAVAHGGTGASSLTDGGVLLGSGTGAVTAMAVLADSEMIVGDGTTDPVAESGATLRTSIGVGTGDSPQFTAIELGHASDTTIARSGSGAITVEGTQVLLAGAALTGSTIDASTDFTIGDTVITDGVITDTSGLSIAAAVDLGANTLTSTGSMQIRTIDYSDGDLAMTIADGGGVTFAQDATFSGAVDIEGGFANGGGAPYDGVVDVGNGGNWTTIQAGDDDLDGGSYVMLVKSGTYSAGVTVSTNNAKIVVETGTVIQGAIVLSGDNVTLELGAGCDVQSTVTLSGANCSLICQNGVDLDGIIVSGNFGFVDGGGWDTLSHGGSANDGINVSGTDVIVQNISAQTSGGSYDACESSGERTIFDKIKVVGADRFGFLASADEVKILNSVIADSGSENIFSNSTEGLIAYNYCNSAGLDGIECDDSADNSVIIGNIVRDQASDSIELSAACENCVVVGNRTDGAIADNSGTSTVSGNDTTAF